jgi:hypothetical protein
MFWVMFVVKSIWMNTSCGNVSENTRNFSDGMRRGIIYRLGLDLLQVDDQVQYGQRLVKLSYGREDSMCRNIELESATIKGTGRNNHTVLLG